MIIHYRIFSWTMIGYFNWTIFFKHIFQILKKQVFGVEEIWDMPIKGYKIFHDENNHYYLKKN